VKIRGGLPYILHATQEGDDHSGVEASVVQGGPLVGELAQAQGGEFGPAIC